MDRSKSGHIFRFLEKRRDPQLRNWEMKKENDTFTSNQDLIDVLTFIFKKDVCYIFRSKFYFSLGFLP